MKASKVPFGNPTNIHKNINNMEKLTQDIVNTSKKCLTKNSNKSIKSENSGINIISDSEDDNYDNNITVENSLTGKLLCDDQCPRLRHRKPQ